MSPQEFVRSGRHLPEAFRDLHDQKDLFKTIDGVIDWKARGSRPVGWIDAQIYVIDIFLWYMAKRGWTLQRCRSKVDYLSYEKDLEEREKREVEALREVLEDTWQPSPASP